MKRHQILRKYNVHLWPRRSRLLTHVWVIDEACILLMTFTKHASTVYFNRLGMLLVASQTKRISGKRFNCLVVLYQLHHTTKTNRFR